MSTAATLPDLPPQPGPTAAATPRRFAPLLALVRRIIDYGRQFAAALQHPTPTADLDDVAATFGSYDFGQILASILRGLHRACALEARLTRLDARPPPQPRPAAPLAPPRPSAAAPATSGCEQPAASPIRPAASEQNTPATGLDPVVRSRPIGAVLADICRDLGITSRHPLWRELFAAILDYGGNLARLCRDIALRPWLDPATRQPITAGVPLFCRPSVIASTGPPL